jgi:transposase
MWNVKIRTLRQRRDVIVHSATSLLQGLITVLIEVLNTELQNKDAKRKGEIVTIDKETETEIIRLFEREKLRKGNIARVLKIHRDTVTRVLNCKALHSGGDQTLALRRSILRDFQPFIEEQLSKYPKMHASRIYYMLRERGYQGTSTSHVRHLVQSLRKREGVEAFQRLSFLPGECAQVDWAEFGKVKVGAHGTRKLLGFVMTLCYSRAIYLHFFYKGKTADFLRGFQHAFHYFNGVTRTITHDNLKSGVIDRIGQYVQFNKELLQFAQHYGFAPRAAGPYRGSDKGRVERSIGYIRSNFFMGLEWNNLAELNSHAYAWCKKTSMERKWKNGSHTTVAEVFFEEKEKLLPLPKDSYPIYEREQVSVGKTPYVRFDTNDYSVPAKYVRQKLEVIASETTIKILEGTECISVHERNYGKNETVSKMEHIQEIRKSKPQSRRHSGLYLLESEIPEVSRFVEELAKRGQNIGGCVNSLLDLKEKYGKEMLRMALIEVVEGGSVHLRGVHLIINKLVHQKSSPVTETIPIREKFKNLYVQHHDLKKYDLNKTEEE